MQDQNREAALNGMCRRTSGSEQASGQEITPDTMNWFDVPFIDYMNAVDDLMADLYGIPAAAGADPGDIAAAQEEGDTPEEFVASIARQYGLERMPPS